MKPVLMFELIIIILQCMPIPGNAQSRKPAEAAIKVALQEAYDQFRDTSRGANASYIPYLANVNSRLFGIAIATADGKVYELGDTEFEFGIESISKAFVLAMAMQERGATVIEDSVGVNATGLPFNSVLAIELEPQRAVSPLVNAGAIATNSLIKGTSAADQWNKIDHWFDRLAGRDIKLIDELYRSEAATNQHNQAIAMLLASYGRMYSDPRQATDSYTKQCSMGTSARDLAVMAGVLANNGVQPVTKEKIIEARYIPRILACMAMEGLYERSGDWIYRTGVPGKSGVGGGVIAVVPGVLAICAFAPPLDPSGNSVKAQKAIRYIVEKLELNLFLAK